ncbi:MAG TPA: choice-of-anchor tandem repeat GloVer-containing protein [Chthoniobacterales bacterium]|jgi:uncharacterized repeat protein (TIGR03803 family)
MKKSIHQTTLTTTAARAARHLTIAAFLIAITVAVPRLACAEAVETTLASFNGDNGSYPTTGLVLASDGNFYGTTPSGGSTTVNPPTRGVAYRITPSGTLTPLVGFTGAVTGEQPLAALIQGSDGNLYGTTAGGFDSLYGTVFKLTLDGTLTTLFVFTYDSTTDTFPDGNAPEAALVEGPDGNLYGTTAGGGRQNGGSSALGTIFKMSPAGDLLGSFPVYGFADISIPNAPLLLGPDGAFYSTAYQSGGGLGSGAVYQFSAAGVVTVLHGFNDTPDGNVPNGGLVLGSDGNFYGTTQFGGTSHLGTAYRISPEGTYEELLSFDGSNGAQPLGQMIKATDGNFYGTTVGGGSYSQGTVFQLTPAGALTTVYDFTYSQSGDTDGAQPKGTLVQGADGRLYGTSQDGGLYNMGAVFALDLGLPGTFTLTSAASIKHGLAIDLPLTGTPGVEDRSGGQQGTYSITMTFSNNLASVASVTSSCGTVARSGISNTNPDQFTVRLVGVTCNAEDVTVTLSNVQDDQSNTLASASVTMGLLLGDVDGDGIITKADLSLVKADLGQKTDGTNFREDVDANGTINSADVKAVKRQKGTFLP